MENHGISVCRFLDHVEVIQLGGDALPLKGPVIFPCMRWVGDAGESQVQFNLLFGGGCDIE